jgi:beta-1,2-mannobiose phosphorylase / 1,2-beta-oligomannan phosphorylase
MIDKKPPPARRLAENPLLTPHDVPPSVAGWTVVGVFNAGVANYQGETVLLVRVSEAPGPIQPQKGDSEIDLSGPGPRLRPVQTDVPPTAYWPLPMLDTGPEPKVVVRYVRRDAPGIQASYLRGIHYGDRFYSGWYTTLRLAYSRDGVHFVVNPAPALQPADPLEAYGVEDPRITFLDGVYYINYTATSAHGFATALASTRDFRTFDRHGIIFCPENRDVTIFPEKVTDQYMALNRPVPQRYGGPQVWLATSSDLIHWGQQRFVFGVRPGSWDSSRVGGGAVPIRTERGWLEIYHGVDDHHRYALGAILLDADEPWRVVARSEAPLLEPETRYETAGLVPNTVFTCGAEHQGAPLRVYYGAADDVLCAADFSVQELLASLPA